MSWVNQVCKWPFKRIIPCHMSNDLKADSVDFRAAFDFLYEPPNYLSATSFRRGLKRLFSGMGSSPIPLPEDVEFLSETSKKLTDSNVLYPEAPLLKRG